jgi:predicted nuclease of predicted toxin-antitoxin system
VARLYADENFPRPVVVRLAQMGHDVLTTQETGRAGEGVPDHDVLAFAIAEERAVITYNRSDFMRLHRTKPEHRGIIVCTVDEDVAALAERVDAAIKSLPDLHGQLIRINRGS